MPRTRKPKSLSRVSTAVHAAVLIAATAAAGGCGGDARVDAASATAIESLAAELQTAVAEYHQEIARSDDQREAAVVEAFLQRIGRDAGNDLALQQHTGEFQSALAKIRADRNVETRRYAASQDNVGALREVSTGLHKLAVESLTLRDEVQRYVTDLVQANHQAIAALQSQGAQ